MPVPDQTFLMLSRKAFADLRAQGRHTYDQTVYVRQNKAAAASLRLHGQPLDVLHVAPRATPPSFGFSTTPTLPVICRILHNPLGVDWVLNAIREPAGWGPISLWFKTAEWPPACS
ncbi:MAG: hypothetical protein WKG07_11355 [Hymenobacter sp.]